MSALWNGLVTAAVLMIVCSVGMTVLYLVDSAADKRARRRRPPHR